MPTCTPFSRAFELADHDLALKRDGFPGDEQPMGYGVRIHLAADTEVLMVYAVVGW